MEKSNYLNRRHLFQETNEIKSFLTILQNIDRIVSESMHLDLSSSKCIIYGENENSFKIGREVVGNETNLNNHESIFVQDYAATEGVMDKVSFKKVEELLSYLKLNQGDFDAYRLAFYSLESVDIFFFNLEK